MDFLTFVENYLLYFVGLLILVLYLDIVHSLFSSSGSIASSFWQKLKKPHFLARYNANPLLLPQPTSFWESEAVFNPAAIVLDNRIHLLYRALGGDGISRWGYASSVDGIHFDIRLPYPVFALIKHPHISDRLYDRVLYPSGGSWGGAEDPRAVVIDNKVYVTFNAFDGWDFIRVGFTSLGATDFVQKRFYWNTPQLLSPAQQINKNWVLFPEKINGSFAILHSITPRIQIEYVASLEDVAYGKHPIRSEHAQSRTHVGWEKQLRSAATPPLRTKDGWLLFYHAHDHESHRYKLGAMLLDLQDPTIILHRSPEAVLAPDAWYENEWKVGVVYACGAVIKDGELLVYYGGGDRTVNVAKAPLNDFLRALTHEESTQLTTTAIATV